MPLTPEEVIKNIAQREAEPIIDTINKSLEEATKIPISIKVDGEWISPEAMRVIGNEFFSAGWQIAFSNYLENNVKVTNVLISVRQRETPANETHDSVELKIVEDKADVPDQLGM